MNIIKLFLKGFIDAINSFDTSPKIMSNEIREILNNKSRAKKFTHNLDKSIRNKEKTFEFEGKIYKQL